jgi:hypothetical protein
MEITIGSFDAAARAVTVTFDHEGVTHVRSVNAVVDEAGEYDAESTAARVDEVAAGVAYKIELGVIVNAPPAVDLPPWVEDE